MRSYEEMKLNFNSQEQQQEEEEPLTKIYQKG